MENYLPGYGPEQKDPNVGTLANPEDLVARQGDLTQPFFDHATRLRDKLLGAVEFNMDRAIQRANAPDDLSKPVASPDTTLPPAVAQWVERNRVWAYGLMLAGAVFVFATVVRALRG